MATPITPHMVRQADHIVTAYRAHQILANGIRTSTAGCKPREYTARSCRLFLNAALLTIRHDPTFSVIKMNETLTKGLSNTSQIELDVLELVGTELQLNVRPSSLRWITRRINETLTWTAASAPDVSLEERQRRKAVVDNVKDALIRSTLIIDLDEIVAVALDSTAVKAYTRKKRRLYKSGERLPDTAYEGLDPATAAVIAKQQGHGVEDMRRLSGDPNATGGIPTNQALGLASHHGFTAREIESSILRTTNAADPDAQYSGKTPSNQGHASKKNDPDGHSEIYFGFQYNFLTTVGNLSRSDKQKQAEYRGEILDERYQPKQAIPKTNIPDLVLAAEVVSAGQAQADPAVRNLRRAINFGVKPEYIVIDAEFSSSTADVWSEPLAELGVKQVLTLRKDQLDFTEFEGALVRGNEVYCPSADFQNITVPLRPRPRELHTDVEVEEFGAEMQSFWDGRDRQFEYLSPIKRYDDDGTIQITCCARGGQVGCPLVPGTVEAATEAGLPIIANPPPPDKQGKLCKQDYLTVPGEVTGKLAQKFPFGSRKWEELNNGRSSVEGFNGSVKNKHNEGLRRGVHEFRGLVWENLFAGLVCALANHRHLQNWAVTYQPNLDHILINPDPEEWNGWDPHTPNSALNNAATADERIYSYEITTHTCDKVESKPRFRIHDGPDDDPNGYLDKPVHTDIWDDQCEDPDCRILHTYGTVLPLVVEQHEHAVNSARVLH